MLNKNAKVGLMVILTTIALLGIYYFLTGAGLKAKAYEVNIVFRDAHGLERGAPVRMSGVKIGQLESVEIQESPQYAAVVKLLINRKYQLGRNFTYTIGTSGLLGQPYVEIIPNGKITEVLKPNESIRGVEGVELSDLIPEAKNLMENLNSTVLVAKNILSDKETIGKFKQTVANLEMATARADQLVASFQGITAENRSRLALTLANTAEASGNLSKMTATLQKMAARPDLQENFAETLQNARIASERLNQASQDIQKMTGDEKFTGDIKGAVADAHETANQAKMLTQKLNKAVDDFKSPDIKVNLGLDKLVRHPRIDLIGGSAEGDMRGDINFKVPQANGSYLLWGIRNVAESNKLNLEMSRPYSKTVNLRYGIWAGHLGAGLDYTPKGRYSLETDIYGTNNPQFDIHNRWMFHENYGGILGIEGLGKGNRIVGGVTFTK